MSCWQVKYPNAEHTPQRILVSTGKNQITTCIFEDLGYKLSTLVGSLSSRQLSIDIITGGNCILLVQCIHGLGRKLVQDIGTSALAGELTVPWLG